MVPTVFLVPFLSKKALNFSLSGSNGWQFSMEREKKCQILQAASFN